MNVYRQDVRPGLISKGTHCKQFAENTKKDSTKTNMKPKRVMEQENRLQGLEKSLTSENKGFALLQKMGYKPGMSIGKSGGRYYIMQ